MSTKRHLTLRGVGAYAVRRSAWECLQGRSASGFSVTTEVTANSSRHLFAFPASQGGLLAQPPLAIPRGTRLRGPSGSLRCSIYRGVIKLGSSSLRHPMTLFPDKSALLARVNGTGVRAFATFADAGKAALLDLAFSRIQGWQTWRVVALSKHRTSRGPVRRHGCYIDSTPLISNTRQHPHLRTSLRGRPVEH